jgi:hypothetical protein
LISRLCVASKSFWGEVLGVGTWYYDIAIRVVELGMVYREKQGGFMYLPEVLQLLNRSSTNVISELVPFSFFPDSWIFPPKGCD